MFTSINNDSNELGIDDGGGGDDDNENDDDYDYYYDYDCDYDYENYDCGDDGKFMRMNGTKLESQ